MYEVAENVACMHVFYFLLLRPKIVRKFEKKTLFVGAGLIIIDPLGFGNNLFQR